MSCEHNGTFRPRPGACEIFQGDVDWEMQVVGTLGAPALSDGVREEEPDMRQKKSCGKEGSLRVASEWDGLCLQNPGEAGPRDQNGAPGHGRCRQHSAEGSGHPLCVCRGRS